MDAPAELAGQLTAFVRAHSDDPDATVSDVVVMPGHAGFSYGFTLHTRPTPNSQFPTPASFVLRLPPPGVRYEGTADVLRQARVLRALQGSGVPVAEVRWAANDERWFGRPYVIVPRLPGDTLRAGEGDWEARLAAPALQRMGRQAVAALAALHAVDWKAAVPEWGPPLDPAADVERWDRFWERTADPELVTLGPTVKRRLLERIPAGPRMGIFHGDFQWSNFLFDGERLVAVLDWELTGVGPVLNDLGWLMVFCDPESWVDAVVQAPFPSPEEIEAIYAEETGADLIDVAWHRALAGYKFAIISGFNLMLHRRGKREDPQWEVMAPSVPRLLERALEVLG